MKEKGKCQLEACPCGRAYSEKQVGRAQRGRRTLPQQYPTSKDFQAAKQTNCYETKEKIWTEPLRVSKKMRPQGGMGMKARIFLFSLLSR